jgi:hypothetical protein
MNYPCFCNSAQKPGVVVRRKGTIVAFVNTLTALSALKMGKLVAAPFKR